MSMALSLQLRQLQWLVQQLVVAKKAQQQVSITENARKAETREKIDAAQGNWQKWSLIALGVVALALIIRAWIQRRG